MSVSSLKILRRYEYDPLDRLSSTGLLAGDSTQRFYQGSYLITELGQQTQRTIFRHEAQPLAQIQGETGVSETTLLGTDRAHSLLQTVSEVNRQQFEYTVYGYHPADSNLSRLLGFNGECPDDETGNYPLGQGNRFYNPILLRFMTPDELSPFDKGGINAYAYCADDPINNYDPSGNSLTALFRPWNFSNSAPTGLNLIKRPSVIAKNPLYTTRRTANYVSSPISAKSNPILGGLLDQPPRDLQQPGPSRALFPSRSEASEPQLLLTGTKRTSQPKNKNSYRKEMAAIEREFDQLQKANPNLSTLPTTEQSERLRIIERWLIQPETSGQPRNRLQQQRLDTIRQIKRDTLKNLNVTNRTIRK